MERSKGEAPTHLGMGVGLGGGGSGGHEGWAGGVDGSQPLS